MNIAKAKFIEIIKYIEHRFQLVEDIAIAYEKNDIPNEFYAECTHIDEDSIGYIISLLEILTNDTKDHWISWFVFENDFGKKHNECYYENDEMFYLDTPEDLYDFLEEEDASF